MRLFGGERMQNMMEALNLEDDMPLENKMLPGTIESAQQKVLSLIHISMCIRDRYSLYEDGAGYTQRDLCSAWHYPPQTINSALKSLVNQGYIRLKPVEGNQKNKRSALTETGKELMREVIFPLIQAEKRTFQRLEKSERDTLLSLTHKYVSLLKGEVK